MKSYLKIGLFRPLKSPSSVYHFRKINKISFFINKSSRRVIWSFWFYRNVPVSPRIISGILNTCWKCLEHIFRINFKSNIFSKIFFFQTKIGQTRVTKKDFQKKILLLKLILKIYSRHFQHVLRVLEMILGLRRTFL